MGGPVEVITFGCRLNAHESDRIADLTRLAGLSDAVVVNTCAVTAEAVRQSRQAIRRASRDQPNSRVIATGCAVEIDPSAFAGMPEVDHVVGNRRKTDINAWRSLATGRPAGEAEAPSRSRRARAYVEVQNGCDHRCTFCVIPHGRGPSRSAPIPEVVSEARSRTGEGFAEVVLTGVDLTAYGADLPGAPTLGELVEAILEGVPDLLRLRLSSIDAAEVDPLLERLLVSESRLMPHLHLSLQAGDDLILKRMKRRHSRSQAVEFCRRLRARRDIAFGADLIAGFPTETPEMFENSLRLLNECRLSYLHVFPFSPRPGTPAARMPQLSRGVVRDRASRLREAAKERLSTRLQSRIGRSERILVERPDRGRTECYAVVEFRKPRAETSIGKIVTATILGHEMGRLFAA